ncbi:MAG: hypothetical protein P1U63_07660 [Coxiellaceae bacterium]|nr:hypothetical protein [Coxiellaceae bacterium]
MSRPKQADAATHLLEAQSPQKKRYRVHSLPSNSSNAANAVSSLSHLAANTAWLLMLRSQDTRSNQIIAIPSIDGQYNPKILIARWITAALLAIPLAHLLIRNCSAQKHQIQTCSIAPKSLVHATLFAVCGFAMNAISAQIGLETKAQIVTFLMAMGFYSLSHMADAVDSVRTSKEIGQSLFNEHSNHAPIRYRHRNAELANTATKLALAGVTLSFMAYAISDKMPGVDISDGWHDFFSNAASFMLLASMAYSIIPNLMKLSALCLQPELIQLKTSLNKRHSSDETLRPDSVASTDMESCGEEPSKTPEPIGTPGVVDVTNPLLQGLDALPNGYDDDLEFGSEKHRTRSMG